MAKFDSRTLVADRVKYLRLQRDKETSRRNWALGRGLPVKTLERIENGPNAITLDTLDAVAEAAGVEPWQLLAPLPQEVAEIAARLTRIAGTKHGRIAIAQCVAAAFAEVEDEPLAETPADPEEPPPARPTTPRAKARGA